MRYILIANYKPGAANVIIITYLQCNNTVATNKHKQIAAW